METVVTATHFLLKIKLNLETLFTPQVRSVRCGSGSRARLEFPSSSAFVVSNSCCGAAVDSKFVAAVPTRKVCKYDFW
ncbi:hypothetical protein L596_028109 [Steinernema carpocapsae]|uniref:Uncharacterized protein n=1 Tax=Steinernema carpocapsae TaxID=34508 RepID=A0A4U5LXG2_STECR|nr:hypothetical protein L596_028109 [Steinernema carpocapsae]